MPKEEHKHSKHHAPKKVFDVTRPGKSTASPNSRSVIVGHKPPVADDQFVPGAASTAPTLRASDPFEKHDLMDSKKKKLVLPVSFSSPEEIASAPALPGSKDVDGDESVEAPVAVSQPESSEIPVTVSVAAAAPAAPDAVSDDSSTPAAPVPNPAPTAASPSAEAADMSISEDGQPQMAVPVSNVAASSAPAESQDAWEADDDSNPAHLAMGQTIESNARPEASVDSTPSPSFATENEQPSNVAAGKPSKSIEDLLAESGAPVLDTQPGPGLIVSQHKSHHGPSIWASILIFLLTLALIALVADVLLDSEIWKPAFSIPHTHFIK